MDDREKIEAIAATKANCHEVAFDCPDCPLDSLGCKSTNESKRRALRWFSDHPETPEPVKPTRLAKHATRGEIMYTLDFSDGRLTVYRFHGKDYESVGWGGTVADFNQFDESDPEGWLSLAAKMIERSAK